MLALALALQARRPLGAYRIPPETGLLIPSVKPSGWNVAIEPNWPKIPHCGVEMWRGGLGAAYLWPALSSAGASLAAPCFRFHIPLIEPDVRICRIRLSEKTHAIAVAIACDAVCNF